MSAPLSISYSHLLHVTLTLAACTHTLLLTLTLVTLCSPPVMQLTSSLADRHSVHQQSWPSQCGRSSSAATAVLGPRSAAVVPSSRSSSSSSYLPAEADQAPGRCQATLSLALSLFNRAQAAGPSQAIPAPSQAVQSRTNRLSAEQTQLCPNPDLCWRGAGPPQGVLVEVVLLIEGFAGVVLALFTPKVC